MIQTTSNFMLTNHWVVGFSMVLYNMKIIRLEYLTHHVIRGVREADNGKATEHYQAYVVLEPSEETLLFASTIPLCICRYRYSRGKAG